MRRCVLAPHQPPTPYAASGLLDFVLTPGTPNHNKTTTEPPPTNPPIPEEPSVKPATTNCTAINPSDFAQRSQNLVASLQRLVDLRKQIKRRYQTVSASQKKVADALHRWCPFEQQAPPLADTVQVRIIVCEPVFRSFCLAFFLPAPTLNCCVTHITSLASVGPTFKRL
ncbi:unnamed protein product [Dibothriocephalus latus]|uniref:Uncharacterized protein n=1 Tax=Dibothriocephalus latus TaxID=60516 RepID=A0A3P7P1X8_DIBLA|nr:unnamed protein product [Dibothriocephalus latus]